MLVKVKLIDRNGWEKVIDTEAREVKYMNLFGEESIKLIPIGPYIVIPHVIGNTVSRKDFYPTDTTNELWIYEER